jgi:hypothetical protein
LSSWLIAAWFLVLFIEDLIEVLFDTLHLPTANRYAPEITPHLDSARDLGIYLQSKVSSS